MGECIFEEKCEERV